MTTLYLVRHAHAEWTPDEQRPLSARGRDSAALLGNRLSTLPIAAIYASPARRAVQTIEPLAQRLRLDAVIELELRERELVVPPGMQFESAIRALWSAPDAAGAGTESNHVAQARGLVVVRRILAEQSGRHVVAATHGNLLALILNGLEPSFGFDFWRALTFPDVYELQFHDTTLRGVQRVWR